jgi:hypothetical protein
MNEKIKDGGPAFPINDLSVNNATGEAIGHQYIESGISTRDYFAAKAMQAFITSRTLDMDGGAYDDCISRWSYETADAMLRAREAS